ncbi:cell wall-active antibiotics response protein LiaF [Bacillus sp. OV322]|uniref:cell wall-active antibiotics response protein LiaF n=1 Tax=Bacillus sp. OV322 TaxID=1882764 RepID=UPI000B86E1C2|nr:cell wall-active antibiotics response protein LiaF [Bacillus sp. OV322]
MLNKHRTEWIGWVFLTGIVLLFLELVFFDGDLFISLPLSFGCLYLGKKKYHRAIGKMLFWIGLFSTVVIVLQMMVFKFFILAILAYLLYTFYQSKKNPDYISPVLIESKNRGQEPLIKKNSLFENKLFGGRKTPDHVYEWNDVNIQTGIGDTVIDLSNTILPKGDTFISIRGIAGNVRILVPYDMEVSIHHSVIAGSTSVFNNTDRKIFNSILSFQTPGFNDAEQKIAIITSLLIGDLEVKRI